MDNAVCLPGHVKMEPENSKGKNIEIFRREEEDKRFNDQF